VGVGEAEVAAEVVVLAPEVAAEVVVLAPEVAAEEEAAMALAGGILAAAEAEASTPAAT
jgi:hypothetical protein